MSERVRVAVRINPHSADPISLYETESLEGSGFKLTMKGSGPLDQSQVGTVKRQLDGIFQVDDVLIGEVSQEQVWQRFETPIMDNVFDADSGLARFGVTLMAYGQTGAGKTFTMMGPEECKHQPLIDGNIHQQAGICLRLCHSLFQRISHNLSSHAVHTIVTVGLLELYNEKMFDLLGPGPWNQNIEDRKPLKLGKNRAGYWPMGQVLKSAQNLTEVAAHLVEGYKHVTMGATAMNERSSRGHTIITIKVSTGDPALPLNHKIAKIQIVDLAGSERASATDGKAKEGGVTHLGTLKEATAINKALYNLGMMVEAAGKPPKQKDNTGKPLSEEKQRSEVEKNIRLKSNDSILTKLLLDSIGGNVASFLIVAVRDDRQYFAEIKSSLDFGQKCRNVKNNPKEMLDAANLQLQLAHMKEANAALRKERDELIASLKKERDELLARLRDGGMGGDADSEATMQRLQDILVKMTQFQDELLEHSEAAEDMMAKKLDLLEEWLEDTNSKKLVMSNKLITSCFKDFESRSLCERLRLRVHDPAVRMPAVPVLISENPTESGVISLTLHPGVAFGADGTREIILGSQNFVEQFRKRKKNAELSAARLAVATKSADKASESEIARLRAEKVEADKSVQDMQRHMTDKDTCECLALSGRGVALQHCRLSLQEESLRNDANASVSRAQQLVYRTPTVRKRARQFRMQVTCLAAPLTLLRAGEAQELTIGEHTVLRHGDRLDIGGCRFVFVEPGTQLPRDPATRLLPPAESADEKKKAEERARIAAEEKALEEEERKRAEEVADEAAKAAVLALSEELQSEMNQWLEELKKQSADVTPPRIDTAREHFDLMISYRVNSEQNFANRLYDKIHLTKSPALAKEAVRRCRIPEYARADESQGELDPGICRTFLDSKHIPGGQEWEQVFVKAVANCLVIVPLLSWHEEDGKEPSGSVGQLMSLHNEDKVDNFLLEIVITNALMELPSSSRWLQLVEPIFIGKLDSRGYTEFPFGNISRLPSFPSLRTCRRAAEILLNLGLPVDTRVISFSVREHILRVTAFQGIQLSKLGSEENALQAASKKLVEVVPPLQLKLQKEQVQAAVAAVAPAEPSAAAADANASAETEAKAAAERAAKAAAEAAVAAEHAAAASAAKEQSVLEENRLLKEQLQKLLAKQAPLEMSCVRGVEHAGTSRGSSTCDVQ